MSNSLDQARQHFLDGVQAFEQGHFDHAERAFSSALQLAPGRPSVLMNLGVSLVHLGRFAEAQPLLLQATAADDSQADAWAALGLAQMELGQWPLALLSYQRAVTLGAQTASLRLRLGQCLASQGRHEEAMPEFQAALALDPSLSEAWTQQGHAHRDAQRLELAASCYQHALDLGSDAPLHHYYLAALTRGGAVVDAPRAYVETLFDQYADDFDKHLVTQLGYQGHRVLIECLPAACPPVFDQVLDLGCGTGLCGALVRSRAGTLTGVDLSGAMVEKARALGVYDHLVQADLLTYLADESVVADLAVAADVFIYVGRLDAVFALLSQRLRPQGWLAFTVEVSDEGQDVQLHPTLRFSHSRTYLENLAARHGFRWVASHQAPLRLDQTNPMEGEYAYLQKI
jgi:predicted TPR repeat methyltransferase